MSGEPSEDAIRLRAYFISERRRRFAIAGRRRVRLARSEAPVAGRGSSLRLEKSSSPQWKMRLPIQGAAVSVRVAFGAGSKPTRLSLLETPCESVSRSFTTRKVAANADAHMARLRAVSEKIEELQAALPQPIDPRLAHYLQRRSYDKALEFLENS